MISSKQRDRLQIWDIEARLVSRLSYDGRPGGKDEEEDGPLKEGVVNDVMDDGAEEVPLGLEPGSLAAGTTPGHRRENNQVNDNIDTLKLSKHRLSSANNTIREWNSGRCYL